LGVASVAVLCWLSLTWYFVEFTPTRVYGNYTAVTADTLIRYMQENRLGADWRIVFFGAPEMYVDFGSIKYVLNEVETVEVTEPPTTPLEVPPLPADKKPIFFFMPARRAELDVVQQAYPGGRIEALLSPQPGATEPLLYVYRTD
jgi:hypothetical protein